MSSHSSSSSFEQITPPVMDFSIRSAPPSPVPSLGIESLPPSRSSSPYPSRFNHHPQFYICDEMADFLVEGSLFRVHRFFLDRESKIFPKISGLETTPGLIELGPKVTRFEFESLLNFIYNGMHTKYTPSLSEWTALLSISTHFEMANIRNRAISEIDKFRSTIEPVEQVMLAVTHNVPAWLPDAYTALCLREAPITLREMKRIGDETMVLVAEAREAVLKGKLESGDSSRKPQCAVPSSLGFFGAPAFGQSAFGHPVSQPVAAGRETAPIMQEPVLPSSDESLARRIVNEVFWREERELERLEKERKLREVKEAKEKAAKQLLELEEALGDPEGPDLPKTPPSATKKLEGGKSKKARHKLVT